MSLYIQYHNVEKEGLQPLFVAEERYSIYTRRSHVQRARGTVLLIAGIGKPKRYFLWESFEIAKVKANGEGTYIAEGPGWRLSPPQQLSGRAFEAFKRSCANFVAFRQIDDLPYSATLTKCANNHRGPAAPAATISFLHSLRALLKPGTEAYKTVESELRRQGTGALEALPAIRAKKSVGKPRTGTGAAAATQDGQAIKHLRALSIRQPHAEAIMRGIKKFEYRSMPTKIRGRVQIYASLGRYSAEEEAKLLSGQEYGMTDVVCDELPRGVLIGTVEIVDCSPHKRGYKWHLRNPVRATGLLKPKKQAQPVWFNPF